MKGRICSVLLALFYTAVTWTFVGCVEEAPTYRSKEISVVVNGGCVEPVVVADLFQSIELDHADIGSPSMAVWCQECPDDRFVGCVQWLPGYLEDPFQVYAPTCSVLVHELMHVYLIRRYGSTSSKHDEPEWGWVDANRKEICDEEVGFVDVVR